MLDAVLEQDSHARAVCETVAKTGLIMLAGELTTSAHVDFETVVRKTVTEIGLYNSAVGCDGNSCAVINVLGHQSADIAMGVDRIVDEDQGAGDQGLMFGYATNETDNFIPGPISYARKLVKQQAEAHRSGNLDWLRPDAKSQLTFVKFRSAMPSV